MSADQNQPAVVDEVRFRELYEATYADVLRFVQRRVHATHAEDVTGEAFLVAWRRRTAVPDDLGDARAWLFGVARGVMLNHRRAERRRQALVVRVGDPSPEVFGDQDADLAALRLDLASAWARLSATEQEALALAVWDGLDSAGAAVVLGCSATAYRLRLSRARRALKRHVGLARSREQDVRTGLVEERLQP